MKKQRVAISGVLLFDKSTGLSSNVALQKVKRLFNAEKTGHTGTLDPLASGLLPLMFGEATKFAADLIAAEKTYEATVRLGYSSTTGDAEGELTQDGQAQSVLKNLTVEQVEAVLVQFLGHSQQTPPIYSALKKDGRPLYAYAREGVNVEIEARTISVSAIRLTNFERQTIDDQQVDVLISFEVSCGKGTYIRTLGEDIARVIGTQGYLTALRRTRIGDLKVQDAFTLEALLAFNESQQDVQSRLIPMDTLLEALPKVFLSRELGQRFLHGQRLRLSELADESLNLLSGQSNHWRCRVYAPPMEQAMFTARVVQINDVANQDVTNREVKNQAVENQGHGQAVFLGTGILEFFETQGKGVLLRPERLMQVTHL